MQTNAAAQAGILQQILDAQRPLFEMAACEDSDSECTGVSDDKLSVEEIHALQRRLNRGISHRNLRLQQLSHLLSERRRAEQASHQVSQDLQNQALLQAASAAEAESRAQEAASLFKKDSLMRAVEDLASRNAGWDSEQRAENMKVAVAELAAVREENICYRCALAAMNSRRSYASRRLLKHSCESPSASELFSFAMLSPLLIEIFAMPAGMAFGQSFEVRIPQCRHPSWLVW